MTTFKYHGENSAPEPARPVLDAARNAYGMLPNLFRKLAESPALAEGYWELGRIFAGSELAPTEQQVVLLSVSVVNGCTYCVGAHSAIADMRKINPDIVEAIRTGNVIPNDRLQVLRKFTQQVVAQRGWVTPAEQQAFLEAGYSRGQMLDVILGVAIKTMSNYANHIMQTDLDEAFAARRWEPPKT